MKLLTKDHKDLNEFLGVKIEEGTYYFHIPGLCLISPIECVSAKSDGYFHINLANGFLFIKDGFAFKKTNSSDTCIEWSFNINNHDGEYIGHITK
ncbi:MAG: hypothetical protein RSC84_02685 [Peptostreptococcaceae bacterium]